MVAIHEIKHTPTNFGVRPSFAVVFYEDGRSIVSATKHQIRNNNTLGLGRIISPEQITKVFSSLTHDTGQSTDLIPSSVLLDSPEQLIWYKKRFTGDMWFRVGSAPECLVVEWPPLLFVANKVSPSMRVFALGSNARPTLNSRLYHPPLMNINEAGQLCQGTAGLPPQITTASIPQCEGSLIDSQFTHVNHDFTLRQATSNQEHLAYWRQKAKTNKRPAQSVLVKELKFSCCLHDLV